MSLHVGFMSQVYRPLTGLRGLSSPMVVSHEYAYAHKGCQGGHSST